MHLIRSISCLHGITCSWMLCHITDSIGKMLYSTKSLYTQQYYSYLNYNIPADVLAPFWYAVLCNMGVPGILSGHVAGSSLSGTPGWSYQYASHGGVIQISPGLTGKSHLTGHIETGICTESSCKHVHNHVSKSHNHVSHTYSQSHFQFKSLRSYATTMSWEDT